MILTSLILFAALSQEASGVNFSVPATSPQVKAPPAISSEKDKCTVSGRVSNMQSGEPLKKAALHLNLYQESRNTGANGETIGYIGTSEPDGSFKFEAVEPGEYTLMGERTGYVRTEYGSKSGMAGGTIVKLDPGQTLTDLKMQLIPQVKISGIVVDEDGDPVAGMDVQALGRFPISGGKVRYFPMGQGKTDDTGAYRIANLMPGKYYVAATSCRGGGGG